MLAVAAVVWIGLRTGRITRGVFVSPAWPEDVLLGVVAGGLLVGVVFVLERRSAVARELAALLRARLGRLSAAEARALALLSGFAEELFFRGAVQGALGPAWATLLFALLHYGPGRALRYWSVVALLAGAVLAALVWWRGDLLAAIVAHVTVNAVGLLRLAQPAAREPAARDPGDPGEPGDPGGAAG